MKNVWFDVAAVADSRLTAAQGERVAARIRQLGTSRLLYGSDAAAILASAPKNAWAMFRKVPLTEQEFRAIAANVPPYMRYGAHHSRRQHSTRPRGRKAWERLAFARPGGRRHRRGRRALRDWGAYGARKAALDHLTLTFAAEEPDMRAYAVDPGDMRTGCTRRRSPARTSATGRSRGVVPALRRGCLDDRPPRRGLPTVSSRHGGTRRDRSSPPPADAVPLAGATHGGRRAARGARPPPGRGPTAGRAGGPPRRRTRVPRPRRHLRPGDVLVVNASATRGRRGRRGAARRGDRWSSTWRPSSTTARGSSSCAPRRTPRRRSSTRRRASSCRPAASRAIGPARSSAPYPALGSSPTGRGNRLWRAVSAHRRPAG